MIKYKILVFMIVVISSFYLGFIANDEYEVKKNGVTYNELKRQNDSLKVEIARLDSAYKIH